MSSDIRDGIARRLMELTNSQGAEPDPYLRHHLAEHIDAGNTWDDLTTWNNILSSTDPQALAGRAFRAAAHTQLPDAVLTVIGAASHIAELPPAQHPLAAALAAARLGTETVRVNDAPLTWAHLRPNAPHLRIDTTAVPSCVALGQVSANLTVIGCGDHDGGVEFLVAESARPLGPRIQTPADDITTIAFIADTSATSDRGDRGQTGPLFALGGRDGTVTTIDPTTGTILNVGYSHRGGISHLRCVSGPRGTVAIVAAGANGIVTIDETLGRRRGGPQFVRHNNGIAALDAAYEYGELIIVTATYTGTLTAWGRGGEQLFETSINAANIHSLTIVRSRRGLLAAVGRRDGTTDLYLVSRDPSRGVRLGGAIQDTGIQALASTAALHDDAGPLITGGRDGSIRIWTNDQISQAGTRRLSNSRELGRADTPVNAIAVTSNNTTDPNNTRTSTSSTSSSGGQGYLLVATHDRTTGVSLWRPHLSTSRNVSDDDASFGLGVFGVDISGPDTAPGHPLKAAAVASADGSTRLLNVGTGDNLYSPFGRADVGWTFEDWATSVHLAPSHRNRPKAPVVVSGCRDGSALVATAGSSGTRLTGIHTQSVVSVACAWIGIDRLLVATAGTDGLLVLWTVQPDLATATNGRVLHHQLGGAQLTSVSIAQSRAFDLRGPGPARTSLTVATDTDPTLLTWEFDRRELIGMLNPALGQRDIAAPRRMYGHQARVSSVTTQYRSGNFVVASGDAEGHLWMHQLADGPERTAPSQQTVRTGHPIEAVAFDRGSNRLISAHSKGRVIVWDDGTENLNARRRSRRIYADDDSRSRGSGSSGRGLRPIREFNLSGSQPKAVAMSGDDIVVGCRDGIVALDLTAQ